MTTSAFCAIWALRIRVNISASVSCILISMSLLIFLVVQRRAAPLTNGHLTEARVPVLPACLGQARYVTTHAVFTELDPRSEERRVGKECTYPCTPTGAKKNANMPR